MEKKINLVELLKHCPKGMELDCTIFDTKVIYQGLSEKISILPIVVQTEHGFEFELTQYGQTHNIVGSKCVIFPKGKTTWEGFQIPFKDGDIIYTHTDALKCNLKSTFISIFKECSDGKCRIYAGYSINTNSFYSHHSCNVDDIIEQRLATEEEKAKLFQAIKDNGYKWNSETKTLEKLTIPHTPEKFYIRIGDIPSNEKSKIYKGDSAIGEEDGVSVYNCIKLNNIYHIVMPLPLKEGQGITYENLIQEIAQCRYEIEKPRNVYLVSGMEIGKGHDNEPLIKNVKILKDLTGQFNTKNDSTEETKTLEKLNKDKFDIANLKPFKKVLIRDKDTDEWNCHLFSYYYKNSDRPYICIGWEGLNEYKQCIPYEENKHLLGTTNDCDEYFKIWEN